MMRALSLFVLLATLGVVGLYAHELCFGDEFFGGWLPFATMLFGPLAGALAGAMWGQA